MRPGEPPTIETAEAMFHSLFFDPERYDLSAVGRVKMNARLTLDAPDTMRVLRKEDVLAILKLLIDAESLPFVRGSTIDYEESLQGAGFKVNNPNVVAACGCGSSFRVADEEQVSAV